jgi:tripartite-type tricarboxylate transporter receptor subunit TctC
VDAVAKAAPDGHNVADHGRQLDHQQPAPDRSLPHDRCGDWRPSATSVDVHQMVLAHPRRRAGHGGLVAAARAAPGRLNFASYGSASQPHLAFGALMAREGIEMVHVPYRGLTPAVLATLAGETQLTLAGIPSAMQHIQAGTIRALAVGRPARLEALPEVPTLEEAGYAEIDPRTWFGAFAPAGTPPALIARLHRDLSAAIGEASVRERFVTAAGFTLHMRGPEETAAFLREDLAHKGRLIAAAAIRPE